MKPKLILDNHFRRTDELFSDRCYSKLDELCEIVGGYSHPMVREEVLKHLPSAHFYIASRPQLTAQEVATSANLKATIEVAGAFREGLDYEACFEKRIEILSCSPGFRNAVAEMTLAMMLGSARGLVQEHEAFRTGTEQWLADREKTDFTLYNQSIGFIGFGQIAKESHRLLEPFSPRVFAYDPFVTEAGEGVQMVGLEELVSTCRVVVVAAVPSEDTEGLLSAGLIEKLVPGALVIVVSRAWCVDFEALMCAALSGRIQVATDVFPDEPLTRDDPLRLSKNILLSPHRAAAVPGGRQLIGDMILHDVKAILEGRPMRQLKPADPNLVAGLVSAQKALKPVPNT